MKKTIVLILCLALMSLACMGASAIAVVDAAAPVGTATTLTNPSPAGEATSSPTLTVEPDELRCAVVVAIETLHLRGGPSENDIVLTWLNHGVVVEVVDDSDSNWWRVKLGDLEGFARSVYLEEIECEVSND